MPLAADGVGGCRAVVASLLLALCSALVTPAAIITVGDGCTLADAIEAANTNFGKGSCPGGDVGPDVLQLTAHVELTAALPAVRTVVTIEGSGFMVERTAVLPFRIFTVESGGNLTLDTVIVAGGEAPTGGGIRNDGTLFLFGTSVIDNVAQGEASEPHLGGGIENYGVAEITGSTIAGNVAAGAFVSAGGGIYNGNTLTVTNSTISANSVSGSSTSGGGVHSGGSATFTHVTFHGNSAAAGKDIYDLGFGVTLTGSITDSGGCSGTISDGGGNFGCVGPAVTGLDSLLGDYGGPTLTHALLATSNAIEAVSPCGAATDQRGVLRSSGTCDSGAFEFAGCPELVLEDDTILDALVRQSCSIRLGPNFAVVGPSGNLSLRVGSGVTFVNDVSVGVDAELSVELDSALLP